MPACRRSPNGDAWLIDQFLLPRTMREWVATNMEAPDLNQATREARSAGSRGDDIARWNEQRDRALFDLGPVAVYSCDAAGVIREFNRRAVELWGSEPALGDADQRFCGSFRLYRPDGTFMPHEQCPMAEVVAGTLPEARDAEAIVERPDGSRITVVANIRAITNER